MEDRGPKIEILIQPMKSYRFRYESEMNGGHNALHGRQRRTHPTVRLVNYNKAAVITCELAQCNETHDPHPVQLIDRKRTLNQNDVYRIVNSENNYTAEFKYLMIIFITKRQVVSKLIKKEISESDKDDKIPNELENKYKRQIRQINFHKVCLKFSANDLETDEEICSPVYSEAIENSKNIKTCTLKIVNISRHLGSTRGGDVVFLLVDRVEKQNILVKFFELVDDVRVWEECAIFSETDVHHQFAIVVRTPPYQVVDISEDRNVFIELYRPSDGATSNVVPFQYTSSCGIKIEPLH